MAIQRLIESFSKDWQINESYFSLLKLQESNKKIIYEESELKTVKAYKVPVWRLDQKNLNGRIYGLDLAEKVCKENKVTYALKDHPKDDSSGSVDSVVAVGKNPTIETIDGKKFLFAECYFVDEEFAEKVDKLVEHNLGIGLSSSALGEVDDDGKVIVESFSLERYFDMVLEPSHNVFLTKENKIQPQNSNLNTIENNNLNKTNESVLKEAGTEDIQAENPGLLELPENGFNDWNIEKLVSHFVSLAKKKGREAISKGIQNIIRWNKEKNKSLSDKAQSVFDKYAAELDKKEESVMKESSIDFSIKIDNIQNFSKLPKEVQNIIKDADRLESKGYQELLGYKNRKIVFDASGHWNNDQFFIDSLGADSGLQYSKNKVSYKESINKEDIMKNLKEYNLEQKNFIISMTRFIEEAEKINEIEDKINKFKELQEWCLNESDYANPIKELILNKLVELNKQFDELAIKGKQTDSLLEEKTNLTKELDEKKTILEDKELKLNDLYEKFDELKIYANELNESNKNLKKELKEKIEGSKVDSLIEYVEKLEISYLELEKKYKQNILENQNLNKKIKDAEDIKIKEELEFKAMVEASEKKKIEEMKKIKEEKLIKLGEAKIQERAEKEKTVNINRYQEEVEDLYKDWEKQDNRIVEFKEKVLKCRNIKEAQSLKLKINSILHEREFGNLYNDFDGLPGITSLKEETEQSQDSWIDKYL